MDRANETLLALLDAWPDPAILIDPALMGVVGANARARKLLDDLGFPSSDRALDWLSADSAALLAAAGQRTRERAVAPPEWIDVQLGRGAETMPARAHACALGAGAGDLVLVVLRVSGQPRSMKSGSTVREILAQLPIGVLLAEPSAPETVLLNAACAELCGVAVMDRHQLIKSDRRWSVRRAHGTAQDSDDIPTTRTLAQGECSGPEDLVLVPADGSEPRTVSALSAPVYDASGAMIAAVTTVTDVTHHREAEREVRQAREQAEREAQRKGAFYASLSREIRSPLTSILGYVDLIGDPETPTRDRAEWCNLVRRSGDTLMGLIQDLVDLGQMDAGTFRLNPAPMQLGLVLGEVLSVARPRAQRRGIDVAVRYTTPIPRLVRWDATRLRQALTTVTTFCIDHADHGDATLQVAVIGTEAGRKVAFDVSTWCKSVTSEDLAALMDPFTPASASTRAWSLAFPVAARLAAMMGGALEYKTDGQRLWLRYTAAASREDLDDMVAMQLSTLDDLPVSSRPPPRLRGRVLLVEDSEDDRMLVTRLLERSGLQVEAVATAVEALRTSMDEYDAVLMDVELPEMDGLEATRNLRAAGVAVPVVALTAAALVGDRERCLAAGCTAYVSKPIDRPTLLRTLDELISTTEDRRLMSELPEELKVLEPLRSTRESDPTMRDALAQFAERAARYVDHIGRAMEAGDRVGAERAARSLGGTAGSYGFEPLGRAAERLADACKNAGAPVNELRAYVRAVGDIVQRVRAAYPPRTPTMPPGAR